jgi:phosphatidylglycerol:prolipoprotein diacylglycerol transferase
LITISINPIAFTIGEASVRWYGIMVALAVAVVVLWTLQEVRREAKISYEAVITAALVGIPSGIIFSKFLHVIDMWDYYMANPGLIWGFAGLAIWGAVLGATLGVWIYSKFRNLQFGYLVDLVAPGIILAQAVGRVGCTINGCCYGIEAPAWLPWSVVYTHPESYAPLGVALHPTQPYELVFCLIGFVVLLRLRGHLKPDGSLFLIYLSLYSLWRIGIGFLREGTPFLFGLHQAQVIGIVVLLVTVPIMVMRTRWVKAESKA